MHTSIASVGIPTGSQLGFTMVFAKCQYLLQNKAIGHTFDPGHRYCDTLSPILNRRPFITRLVANAAFWYHGTEGARFAISLALQTLERFYKANPKIPPPHLFWRGVSTVHQFEVDWNVANKSGCDGFLQPTFHLTPSAFLHDSTYREFNAIAIDILANLSLNGLFNKIDYFDLQRFDQFRGDAHMGRDDCAHYCGPSVPVVWAQWLLKVLFHSSE